MVKNWPSRWTCHWASLWNYVWSSCVTSFLWTWSFHVFRTFLSTFTRCVRAWFSFNIHIQVSFNIEDNPKLTATSINIRRKGSTMIYTLYRRNLTVCIRYVLVKLRNLLNRINIMFTPFQFMLGLGSFMSVLSMYCVTKRLNIRIKIIVLLWILRWWSMRLYANDFRSCRFINCKTWISD